MTIFHSPTQDSKPVDAQTYMIALKPGAILPSNWIDSVCEVEGAKLIRIAGDNESALLTFTPQALAQVEKLLGESFDIQGEVRLRALEASMPAVPAEN